MLFAAARRNDALLLFEIRARGPTSGTVQNAGARARTGAGNPSRASAQWKQCHFLEWQNVLWLSSHRLNCCPAMTQTGRRKRTAEKLLSVILIFHRSFCEAPRSAKKELRHCCSPQNSRESPGSLVCLTFLRYDDGPLQPRLLAHQRPARGPRPRALLKRSWARAERALGLLILASSNMEHVTWSDVIDAWFAQSDYSAESGSRSPSTLVRRVSIKDQRPAMKCFSYFKQLISIRKPLSTWAAKWWSSKPQQAGRAWQKLLRVCFSTHPLSSSALRRHPDGTVRPASDSCGTAQGELSELTPDTGALDAF